MTYTYFLRIASMVIACSPVIVLYANGPQDAMAMACGVIFGAVSLAFWQTAHVVENSSDDDDDDLGGTGLLYS